jgi:hypothetical protein
MGPRANRAAGGIAVHANTTFIYVPTWNLGRCLEERWPRGQFWAKRGGEKAAEHAHDLVVALEAFQEEEATEPSH